MLVKKKEKLIQRRKLFLKVIKHGEVTNKVTKVIIKLDNYEHWHQRRRGKFAREVPGRSDVSYSFCPNIK